MSKHTTAENKDSATAEDSGESSSSIEPRTRRALCEYLTVLDDVGEARDARDLYVVVSQSGNEYVVDARGGVCTCKDFQHRGGQCKHIRRVELIRGDRPIPAGINPEEIDDQFGLHVDASPVWEPRADEEEQAPSEDEQDGDDHCVVGSDGGEPR